MREKRKRQEHDWGGRVEENIPEVLQDFAVQHVVHGPNTSAGRTRQNQNLRPTPGSWIRITIMIRCPDDKSSSTLKGPASAHFRWRGVGGSAME